MLFSENSNSNDIIGMGSIYNESTNQSNISKCEFYDWSRNPNNAHFFRIFSIISVLTVLVVVVVLGNALVIAAVLLRRRLRSATGLLILSLAVADLLVGTVILPFSIANEVLDQFWIFGETWCTIWLTFDIWMCTASIYNLVAISIDRYIAIIKPLNYPMLVTKFRARCTVAIVWIGSFIICSPSFFMPNALSKSCKCTPENASGAYIIFSASSSFYIPMIIVVFVYFRIYIAARAATKSIYSGMMSVTAAANKKQNPKNYLLNHPDVISKDSLPMLRVHRGSSIVQTGTPTKPYKPIDARSPKIKQQEPLGKTVTNRALISRHKRNGRSSESSIEDSLNGVPALNSSQKTVEELGSLMENSRSSSTDSQNDENFSNNQNNNNNNNEMTKSISDEEKLNDGTSKKKGIASKLNFLIKRGQKKRTAGAYEKRLSLEIKAAKTVAIVTGCFIFCWLGFSLIYGLQYNAPPVVWSILFWLGYLNSALNPVIYTVFNREFRICFKRLLTCHHLNHPTHKYTNNNSYNSTAMRSTNNVNRVPTTNMCYNSTAANSQTTQHTAPIN
ncbi:unnamed protein product [Caenorhabditis angaria]|uniref:G-protein coupled receptors family 1 profile domain-containing protein n=1 Tax=Caenorhabditis angaria TaxID=860376 RepID=A0A9P1MSY2_9PELO|nr:unnamed protein product [Caenorhabditis angaria]